jgi:Tol biopolymer transport system component
LLPFLLAACGTATSASPGTRTNAPSELGTASPWLEATPRVGPAGPPTGPWGPIVFARAQDSRLGIVEADGTGARELLPGFPGELYSVDWSSDGRKAVFYQLVPGVMAGIYETDANGSTPRLLDLGCHPQQGVVGCLEDDWPSFSPDGTHLAVVRWKGLVDRVTEPPPMATVIVVVDLATGEAVELASTELPFMSGTEDFNENLRPRWSPDGSEIVFHRLRSDASRPISSDLWLVRSDGSDLRAIATPDLEAGDADWSPDGSSIVFSSLPLWEWHLAPGQVSGQDIYVIRPDGSTLVRLTADEHSAAPRWTPDGSAILFTRLITAPAGTDPFTDFWLMNADGADPHAITSFGDCCWWYGDLQPIVAR